MTADGSDSELEALLEFIFQTYHYDFRHYSMTSLKRRLMRALLHFGCQSPHSLQLQLKHSPERFNELLSFLTVPVSELFRDPSYYQALRKLVIPYLRTYQNLKVWVAGCATGEEAYSFAILLAEEGLLERTQIYATDISPDSLRIAEAGMYNIQRFLQFSENYRLAGGSGSLSQYYSARYGSAVLDQSLKKAILFADHSLATDGTFAEVELISCRNVLIYFDRTLQDHALSVLSSSLRRKGFLGLGLKETLRFSACAQEFKELTEQERIYQRL